MAKKMDLSIFRLLLMSDDFQDISNELKVFDNRKCTFYYDESNNIRKLWLDENDFNAPIDSDFVLGGVMYFGDKSTADVDSLKTKLRLQKSAKEMKFKHISKAKSFLECLNEEKVLFFLQWLYDSDLYIHFSNVNNLYFAIVDIIDSIDEPGYIPFIYQMKNELYKLVRKNYRDFYSLLVRCNYPNVSSKDIDYFYTHILGYIDNSCVDIPFDLEILRQGVKAARKQKELSFLQGNMEKTVIENYFSFYTRPIGVFPHAKHIFDNEYKIEEIFAEYEFYNGESKLENYEFVNSINNPLVQVSDCIVGLLGKYYTYTNSIDIYQAHQLFTILSDRQRKALRVLAQLIIKSERLSKLLLNSTESIEEHDISSFILRNALIN
ncbi:DUF3800 domain-containing protein [Gallibacter sp. Marseille-QA0791]|uniref:DUF3800 domain-containing protein n=1 Tax=Gallibacter sp. Marseille-QA0791 TaxID=3378781 RepID=UPI003D12A7FE